MCVVLLRQRTMQLLFITLGVLWALLLGAGLLLTIRRGERTAGAVLLVLWLLWSSAGMLPCAEQKLGMSRRSLDTCSATWAPTGPIQVAELLYQRWYAG